MRFNRLHLPDCIRNIHHTHGFALQADGLAKAAGSNQVDGGHAESRCQNPIVGRWRTTALDVSQNTHPNFFAGKQRNRIADHVAYGKAAAHLLHLGRAN